MIVIEDGFGEGFELQPVDYFIGEMVLIVQYFSVGSGKTVGYLLETLALFRRFLHLGLSDYFSHILLIFIALQKLVQSFVVLLLLDVHIVAFPLQLVVYETGYEISFSC